MWDWLASFPDPVSLGAWQMLAWQMLDRELQHQRTPNRQMRHPWWSADLDSWAKSRWNSGTDLLMMDEWRLTLDFHMKHGFGDAKVILHTVGDRRRGGGEYNAMNQFDGGLRWSVCARPDLTF